MTFYFVAVFIAGIILGSIGGAFAMALAAVGKCEPKPWCDDD